LGQTQQERPDHVTAMRMEVADAGLPGSPSQHEQHVDDLLRELDGNSINSCASCAPTELAVRASSLVTDLSCVSSASAWAKLRVACNATTKIKKKLPVAAEAPSWSIRKIKDSMAPVSGGRRDPNATWSLRVSVVGAKDLPKLDTFGLSDPYACISVFEVEDGMDQGGDLIAAIDHNVSKTNRKEHTTTQNGSTTHVLNPMRRTRVEPQTLEPRWLEVFHFDGIRQVRMDENADLVVGKAEEGNMSGKQLVALITLHDHDYSFSDDFSGRVVIPVDAQLSQRQVHMLFNNDATPLIGKSGKQASICVQYDYSPDLLLKKPITDKHFEHGSNHRFSYCVADMQGWRTTMEDAHSANLGFGNKHDAFFAVFDGHGGQDVAQFAALKLPSLLLQSHHYQRGNFTAALTSACTDTDCALMTRKGCKECAELRGEKNTTEAPIPSSGATACMCLVHGVDVYCANIGDSRAVLCKDKDGWPTAYDLSTDHKPTDKVEVERIQAAGGSIIDGRVQGLLAVSRSIGDLEFKDDENLPLSRQMVSSCPDVKRYTLKECDTFILIACDGIWDVFSSQEAVARVHRYLQTMSLQQAVAALLDAALSTHPSKNKGLGTDNMTAMIVDLKPFSSRNT